MSTPIRCALIGSGAQLIACAELLLAGGHRVVGVLTDCGETTAWARRRGVPLAALASEQRTFLGREPFDYLLSIVNHSILAPEVLATPAVAALNYHDSPLPDYAGFNATAWAILEGRTRHGVTWHEMTRDVDAGRIIAQPSFEIGDDDTAFTLSVKCSESGIAAFGELLPRLARRELDGTPQQRSQSFHFRSDRPDVAVLRFERSARELHALVRGLNFGPDDSWMCKPKLQLAGGFVAVTEARVDRSQSGAPGRVLALDARGLTIAASDCALVFSELATLDGQRLDADVLRARFDVAEGQTIAGLDADVEQAARELDARVTKHERFWVKRLQQLHGPALAGIAPHEGSARPRALTRSLPDSLSEARSGEREAVLIAALAAYVARVGDGEAFDLGLGKALSRALLPLYASVTPMRFAGDVTKPFSTLVAEVRSELAEQAKRETYARDTVLRYRALRDRPRTQRALPVAVSVAATGGTELVEGAALTLVVPTSGGSFSWVYDEAAIAAEQVELLAGRFDVLLRAALADESCEVGRLPLLPAAERELLVSTWQDTQRPYDARCVHELFEAQVARTPEATAVRFRERALSYRELDRRANRVANALRAAGVGPEVLVGLCVERSLEMIVGLLGVLKAGGAYVPLDPVYPGDRLAMMLEDARAKVLLTQRSLVGRLPAGDAQVLAVEELMADAGLSEEPPRAGATPENLAYVIFTSGSTGRPKGVMVLHRNAANFFAGMDVALGHDTPGKWLAVTSISFDISVLELFWTLTRGFEVVIQEELDRASLAKSKPTVAASRTPMDFGLFYFAAETGAAPQGGAYRLLLEGARFADEHGFAAVWTPERHFHAFGGLYPNPAVTTAALATITKQVQLRAGSVVLPLHNPLRVAEDWAVIDHLSGGRIGLSFASGWHVNDFAFFPENYERRREIMLESIDTVRRLWRGDAVTVKNGTGQPIDVRVLPRPLNPNPPIWVASAGNVETFQLAGRHGFNVLTNMLGQDLADLRNKLAAYREARRQHGHAGDGIVSVMLHTFVCEDTERARELARRPFSNYLASSFDLVKVAPWMFPAFKQPSKSAAQDPSFDPSSFTPEDMEALLDHAFDRYFETAGLFGSPEHALGMVEQLKSIGANEVACLVDFGIETDEVLRSLTHLDRLRQLSNPGAGEVVVADRFEGEGQYAVGAQLARSGITHLQCTPSMARMLLSDLDARPALAGLKKLMLGGEALPRELIEELAPLVGGDIINMYGPTETTVWSTTAPVSKSGAPITIGRPIANTTIRILDARRELAPIGVPGELCIGGAGVVRGYLGRPDLTAERFVSDPLDPAQRIYRTGDLARYRADGELEFLGRLDHQVKVNGYRIELGEIETVLSRHPSVRQNVVVARAEGGPARLVAYVISGSSDERADDGARVEQWQSIWDETYRLATSERDERASDPRFNIAGWRDSFTGEPIPASEMREWLDQTAARILAQQPRRVLEVGCGTGMILYALLPHVEHYTAVDVSPHALDTIRNELRAEESAKVALFNQPAHAIEGVAPRSVDTVVINSVAQYFPDADYLANVLHRASELVADGGRIFVGDVRNLAHLTAFHARVELTQSTDHRAANELSARVQQRLRKEGELLLAERFFERLTAKLPRVAAVEVQLKRGLAQNEMSCFRYDVVLHIGSAPESFVPDVPATSGVDSLASVAALLAAEPPLLLLSDVPNARLLGVYDALRALESGSGDAGSLRKLLHEGSARGVEPEALYSVHPAYEVDVRQARSGDPTRFDAVLRHVQRGPRGRVRFAPLSAGDEREANQPARADQGEALFAELREHLRQALPEYMVPSAFVRLAAFPLTPNGKIDRKALPPPERKEARASEAFAPPSSDLEEQIAATWQTVLNLERVGRDDNIFDLGANSLLTVQANNRLSALLGRKVSLVSMFRFPTVAALAAHLGSDAQAPSESAQKRKEEREDKRKDAAERRRQMRAERSRSSG